MQLLLLFHATLYRHTRSARPISPHHKARTVCRQPRGHSECRRVTPRTGLQPGAGTLERTVPRVCVGSATGAETAPRITREWRWNGPQPVEMENRKIEIFPLEYSTEPRFVFPRMPLTFFGPNRPNAGPTPAPLPPAYQKNQPPMFPHMGF